MNTKSSRSHQFLHFQSLPKVFRNTKVFSRRTSFLGVDFLCKYQTPHRLIDLCTLINTLVPQLGLSSILQNQLGVALDALTVGNPHWQIPNSSVRTNSSETRRTSSLSLKNMTGLYRFPMASLEGIGRCRILS